MTQSLFQFEPRYEAAASLPPLPCLDGIGKLGLDTETTVEEFLFDRELVGISYYLPDGRKGYVPIKHMESENYPEEMVKEWVKRELRGKTFCVANAKHEVHTFNTWGISLEEQGNSFRDVFHRAALINEKRRKLNMDLIVEEELPHIQKIEADHKHLYKLPAQLAAPVATQDAELAWLLDEAYEPKIQAENLGTVCQLEDDLVFSTCEMERNGSYLDVGLMLQWEREVKEEYTKRLMEIYSLVGFMVNPNAPTDMLRLFKYLGIENTYETESGEESFKVEVLQAYAEGRPAIQLCLEAKQMSSLLSKSFEKFAASVRSDGRVFYALHQLRSDEGGTITGRYSSSAPGKKKNSGINIQQVSKTDKMPKLLQRWPIRKLFIAPPGEKFFSSDASQIEFRLFSHYAAKKGMPRLAQRFNEDPTVDFHSLIVEWTNLIRSQAKNVNFAKLYGGGPAKIAGMCGVSLVEGEKIVNKYDREFPEAKILMDMAQGQAMDHGFVRTLLLRRRRYDRDDPEEAFYSALNSVLQGGAADLVKLKILRLYNERKRFGLTLRSQVHDEANGSIPEDNNAVSLNDFMNEQEMDLELPIMWKSGVGKNWEEAH